MITMPVGDLPELIERFQCGICANSLTAESFAAAIGKAIVTGKDGFKDGIDSAKTHFDIKASVSNWIQS